MEALHAPAGIAQANALVQEWIERADPVIQRVMAYYVRRSMLRRDEVDDVVSTVRTRLFMKLRRVAESESEAIESFDGYVAGLAYNAVNDLFRNRYPERTLLKKRMRRIALLDPRFGTDETHEGLVCRLREGAGEGAPGDDLSGAMLALLRQAGAPLPLNEMVSALYPRWGNDAAVESLTEEVADDTPTPLARLEERETLDRLWQEIEALPERQRAALLLNLRGSDSTDALSLFVLTGVASIDDIAAALGLPAEDLAAVWNDLPLDDLTIAARLGITRQQVINLRKSARARLDRRLRRTI